MTSMTRGWFAAEADAQGLRLDDADADAIYERVAMIKDRIARIRPEDVEALEPVYRFIPPA
jgi:hypothetical protein